MIQVKEGSRRTLTRDELNVSDLTGGNEQQKYEGVQFLVL